MPTAPLNPGVPNLKDLIKPTPVIQPPANPTPVVPTPTVPSTQPVIGQVETVPPQQMAVSESTETKPATHVKVALPDNPIKAYSLEVVKDRYGAIEQYKVDMGIRATTNNFTVSYCDEVEAESWNQHYNS